MVIEYNTEEIKAKVTFPLELLFPYSSILDFLLQNDFCFTQLALSLSLSQLHSVIFSLSVP